jgi:carbonic anhydrase
MKLLIRKALVLSALMLPGISLHAAESEPIMWGYEGDLGPLQWGTLGLEFSLREKGMSQSPIDLLRTHKK